MPLQPAATLLYLYGNVSEPPAYSRMSWRLLQKKHNLFKNFYDFQVKEIVHKIFSIFSTV